MRLYNYLQEAVIKPNMKWLGTLVPVILKQTKGKKLSQVINELNKIFADWFIEFKHTTRQSSDDELAAAGISYAEIETKEPFKITVFLDDLSIFQDTNDEIEDYWIPALFKILSHEMIHRQQFSRMKISKPAKGFSSWKEYYSDKHEIMTFAHDILLFMLGQGISKENMKNMNWNEFAPFKEFATYFNSTDTEYKLLMKYLYQYIDLLRV